MGEFEALIEGDDLKELEEMKSKFRFVFNSPLGLEVLSHILLKLCGILKPAKSMEEVAEQRVGFLILGAFGIDAERNGIDAIRALASIVPKQTEEV